MTDALRHVTIVRDDDVYEAFPDICQLPTGKLLCIYRESDVHRASTSRMILMESEDRGRTWTNKRPFDTRRSFVQNRSTWNAPRIRVLPDGRLVANFDAFLSLMRLTIGIGPCLGSVSGPSLRSPVVENHAPAAAGQTPDRADATWRAYPDRP